MSTVLDLMPLNSAQSNGATIAGVFSLFSLLAFVFVVFRCARLYLLPILRSEESTYRAPENLLFRTHIGHYVGSLLLGNMFLTLGGLIEFHWGTQSGITRGGICSAQAVMMQIGLWSSGYFTVATGVHTCTSLVFRARQIPRVNAACIALGWVIAFILAFVPLEKSDVYGPDGISCGVVNQYRVEYFFLQPFPIFTSIILSAAVYSLIFLVLYGKLSANNGSPDTRLESQQRWSTLYDSSEYIRFISVVAQTMFWYPVAFCAFLLPFCITRLLVYSGYSLSDAADTFAVICSAMLGFVNVGLLYNTFRVISPLFNRPPPVVQVMVETEKSFGNRASQGSLSFPQPAYMPSAARMAWNRNIPQSSFSQTHYRSTSESSADSTTQLIGIKRKSSRYNAMRVRQAGLLAGPRLTISIPPPPLPEAQSPPLVTVSLSAAHAHLSPTSVESHSELSSKDERYSQGHSIEAPTKRPSFKARVPVPLNLDELAEFPDVPLSAYHVSNKSATLASRLGLPSAGLSSAQRSGAPISARVGTAPLQLSATKLDKGKGKAPAPPETPLPRIDITAPDSGRSWRASSIRPLPHLPEDSRSRRWSWGSNSASSSHSSDSSPADAENELDSYALSISDSVIMRPLPALPPMRGSTDVEHAPTPSTVSRSVTPMSVRRQHRQSRRTTMTSVWSQDSAWTKSQPPDPADAYERSIPDALVPGLIRNNQAGIRAVPDRRFNMSPVAGGRSTPKPLRPVKIASRLTVRFAQALRSPISPRGFTIVTAPNDSAV